MGDLAWNVTSSQVKHHYPIVTFRSEFTVAMRRATMEVSVRTSCPTSAGEEGDFFLPRRRCATPCHRPNRADWAMGLRGVFGSSIFGRVWFEGVPGYLPVLVRQSDIGSCVLIKHLKADHVSGV